MIGTPEWGLDAKKQGAMMANCYNVAQQHSGGASREPAAGRGCFRSKPSNLRQPLRPRLEETGNGFRLPVSDETVKGKPAAGSHSNLLGRPGHCGHGSES